MDAIGTATVIVILFFLALGLAVLVSSPVEENDEPKDLYKPYKKMDTTPITPTRATQKEVDFTADEIIVRKDETIIKNPRIRYRQQKIDFTRMPSFYANRWDTLTEQTKETLRHLYGEPPCL